MDIYLNQISQCFYLKIKELAVTSVDDINRPIRPRNMNDINLERKTHIL